MAFEFLNDDDDSLPGSTPGESQPYEMGTQDSFRKKASSFGMRPEQKSPEENDAKGKYVKAKAQVEDAYGTGQKILTRMPNGQFVTGEQDNTWSGIDHQSREDVDLLKDRIANREHPLKIADDMREIAGRPTIPQGFQKLLHQGADKFQNAYQAQATLDQMNQPGGELALGSDELENRYGSAQAEMGNIDDQINQKQEQLKTTGFLRAPKVQQELQGLYNQKKQLAQTLQQGGGTGAPIDKNLRMNTVLTAAGWDRKDFIQANSEVRRIIGTHGINASDPVSPSTFPIIIPKIVEEVFKPEQAKKFYEEINGRPEEQGKEEKPGNDAPSKVPGKSSPVVGKDLQNDPQYKDIQGRVKQSEARHDAIWHELAHSGNFNNVGDVIGFVLTSVVLGPRAGAALFSNMNKNGSLRAELQQVDHETTQLYHRQNSYIQLSMQARKQALEEEYHRDSLQDRDNRLQETERHNRVTESYLNMKRSANPAWTPEEQATDKALQHGVRQREGDLQAQSAKVKSLEKQANNPMDPEFKAARTKLAMERRKLEQLETEHANVMQKVRKWYLDHGGSDILKKAPSAQPSPGISTGDEE